MSDTNTATPAAATAAPSADPVPVLGATEVITGPGAWYDKSTQPDATTEPPKAAEEQQPQPEELSAQELTRALAKERKLRQKEMEIRKREEELSKQYELPKKLVEAQDWDQKLEVLETLGIKYEDITKAVLNRGKGTNKVESEVEMLKTQLAQIQREKEEAERTRQETERQAQIEAARTHIIRNIENSEQYGLVKAFSLAPEIPNQMIRHFEKTGQKLTLEEVAGKMESELESRVLKTLQSSQGKQILAKLLGPDWEDILTKRRKAGSSQATPSSTLTNVLNSTSTATDPAPVHQKKSWLQEEQERSRRALEKLLGG